MNKDIIKRVIDESDYIINNKKTIRQTASEFNVSKSTVHKDMQEKLKGLDDEKYKSIEKIFQEHIETRHINGGNATKEKYLKKRLNKHN